MKNVYRKLVSYSDAVNLVQKNLLPGNDPVLMDLSSASGMILFSDTFAPMDSPPFPRATMDGFAVRSSELSGINESHPVRLRISGSSEIGALPIPLKEKSSCMRIATGAVLPSGADSVVKVESTETEGDYAIIREHTEPGTNVAERGSDTIRGSLLLPSGKILESHDIAVLASMGIGRVIIHRPLRIWVFSTGNELIGEGEDYIPGRIYDSNSHLIVSELRRYSFFQPEFHGIVPDNRKRILSSLSSALESADAVIVSGGSSAGESDMVYDVVSSFSPGLIFHGVLAKPGLPTVFGMSGHKPIIGLPGFPVSATMILRSIFLSPLCRLAGTALEQRTVDTVLGSKLNLDMGKQNLVPVRISSGSAVTAYPVTGLSGSISRFLSTDGYVSVEGTTKFLPEGSPARVIPWSPGYANTKADLVGSVDESSAQIIRKISTDIVMSFASGKDTIDIFRNGGCDAILLKVADHGNMKSELEGVLPDIMEESRVFILSNMDLVATINGKSLDKDFAENHLDAICSIRGLPVMFLERIMNKNASELELLSALKRGIPEYDYRDDDCDRIMEISVREHEGGSSADATIHWSNLLFVRKSRKDITEQFSSRLNEIR